jgi:histidine triad (HIT) family protein
MTANSDCLFCKIVAGDLPANVVHEDDRTVAFMDINPSVRGHTLVVPRAHSTDLHDVDPEDLAACMRTAKLVARDATQNLDADGVNLLQNTGRVAGQVGRRTPHLSRGAEGTPVRMSEAVEPRQASLPASKSVVSTVSAGRTRNHT